MFGPTGNIGSVAAQTAAEHGAKVILAMRDTSKEIKGLSSEQERAGSYERVQADLTKPDSVAEAVKKTGAKRAFIYVAHGAPNGMKETLEAMKSSGIEFVVLLSSFTVESTGHPLREVPPSAMIPYMHAQVEASLEDVYGIGNFVAVRPGAFATNLFRYTDGVKSEDVKVYAPQWKMDGITPGDMGRVSGTLLVNGPKKGERHVYLYGPERKSTGDMLVEVGKVLGKDVKVTSLNEEEGLQQFQSLGLPKPFAEYLMRLSNGPDREPLEYEKGVENVKLYTGRDAQSISEWAKENKEVFA